MHVLGGGQDVFAAPRETTVVTSTPFDNRDRKRVPDDGWKSTVDNFESNVTQNTLTGVGDLCRLQAELREGCVSRGRGRPKLQRADEMWTRRPVSWAAAYGSLHLMTAPGSGHQRRSTAATSTTKTDDGWKAAGVVEERRVDMTLTAICGSKQLEYRADTQTAPANGVGEAFADCPRGSGVVGGGESAPRVPSAMR